MVSINFLSASSISTSSNPIEYHVHVIPHQNILELNIENENGDLILETQCS